MACHTIIKEDQTIPGPELMADAVILCLTIAGDSVPFCNIQDPDTLLYQIPGALMAEHGNVAVIRRELEMTYPMGIRINSSGILSVDIHDHNIRLLNAKHGLRKAYIVIAYAMLLLFVDLKAHIFLIMADEWMADLVIVLFLVNYIPWQRFAWQ